MEQTMEKVKVKFVEVEWTNGQSKICGRQPLKTLKGYGMIQQTIFLQIF